MPGRRGIANSWNGQRCCTVAYDLKIAEVGFLRALIATLSRRANIDADKVHVTGRSNGGGLAQRMACETIDVVRASAPVVHPVNTDTCRPSRPVRVLALHGTADETSPYDGGGTVLAREILGVPLGWQGARQSLATEKGILGCTDTLTGTQLAGVSRDETYASCATGTPVGLVSVAGGKHDLYMVPTGTGAARHIPVAAYIWSHVFRS